MMNSLSSDRREYIVDGAPLECTMQEMRAETINDKVPVNITDANGYKDVREMAGRLCIELPGVLVDILEDNKENNYTVADGVWDKALKAEEFENVPSICKRIIAAKLVYEHFIEETE